jgi:ubiquinone biosynthesis UbiH/UbiF/VisC/COQ6 family hydroxylase
LTLAAGVSANAAKLDIAVIGGGPIGLAAAVALRQAGFDVATIERAARPPPFDPAQTDPRVYAISPASMQLLDALGVWASIAARRAGPYTAMRVWESDPAQALGFDSEREDRPLGWIVEYALLVDALWQRLDGVRLLQGQLERIESFSEGTSAITLDDGRRIMARLVVAADGADSAARALAGLEAQRWDYPQRGIVCHIRTVLPHRDTALQRFLKTGPLALLPCADGRCSIVWSADTALADELLALDDTAFRLRLEAASQGVLGAIVEATPRLAFDLRALHVPQISAAGLVLIGDAAHAIHPLAGQGANLGFGDVAALVASLKAARDAGRDWSGPRPLAAYARARKAETVEMLAMTDALYRAFRLPLPGVRPLLGLGLSAVDRLGPLKQLFTQRALGR